MGFLPLFGAMMGGNEDIYGRKPKPVAVPTADDILEEATLANLSNIGNINKLAATQNEFNLDEALKEFEKVAPGVFPQLIKNITASSRGELSEDVSDEIFRHGAAAGIDSGTSGSEFNRFKTLRDVGVKSMAEQQRGQNNFESLMKGALPNLFDATGSLVKPNWEPYAKFQNDLYNEKVAAAPVPSEAGAAAAQTAFAESMLGAYAGGAGRSQQYQSPWQGGGSGRGASEGGGDVGTPFASSYEWGGQYGETAGFGAFDF